MGAVNIIVGWLLFQVLGFAWKDGHLPGRRRLVALAAASLAAAAALVATGPWPLALVGVPGARFANTWPPSVVLLAYGFGICGLAIAAAPTLDRFLAGRRRAWTLVIAANANAMTSYLWHFTALAVASFGLAAVGLLPTAAAGTGAWWVQKLPVLGAALVVLLGLLALLGRRERAATSPGTVSGTRAAVSGAVLAVGFETWTIAQGRTALAAIGMATVIGVHTALHRPRR